jgi:hypothetical protein
VLGADRHHQVGKRRHVPAARQPICDEMHCRCRCMRCRPPFASFSDGASAAGLRIGGGGGEDAISEA